MALARRPGPTVRTRVREFQGDTSALHEDRVVTEEPLEIRITVPGRAARRATVTMRTPGHDFQLAAGWLRHEGVIESSEDLESVAYCTDVDLSDQEQFNVVTARLRVPPRREVAARYPGATGAASVCGVCGSESIEEVYAAVRPTPIASAELPWPLLVSLPERMRAEQRLFDRTGGLHAAALFDLTGNLLVLREDVGRHNAVDKVTGSRLLEARSPAVAPELLAVSGRIGFEIVQKAVVAGYSALVAVGAPTSLAVDLARRTGLSMVGFARGDRGVVYAGGDRIPGGD